MPEETVSSPFPHAAAQRSLLRVGAAVADFNHDGVLDVIAGPYYYLGPDYTTYREIYLAQTINPSNQYPNDSWVQLAADFTGDGWPDVLTMGHSAPGGGSTCT